MIPYARQDISEDDIEAVVAILRSDWLTQGPSGEMFEKKLASYCGAAHAVSVSSATAALHLSYLALDLGPGDLLWTSPNTFVATANAARFCGANVDFVDVELQTANLSVDALRRKLEHAERLGRLPKIVVPVHFGGQSCDMKEIAALSAKYGFRVVEDASHALGAEYCGERVGSCRYADIAVLSFHAVKIITTGEGGAAMTNNPELAERVRRLRSHGVVKDTGRIEHASLQPWLYEQRELGFNYRLTDIQSALGASQVGRVDKFVARRRHLAAGYDAELRDLPLTPLAQDPAGRSAWHLYAIHVRSDEPDARGKLFADLRARGIGVNVHYIPVHTQPYYRRLGFRPGDFPHAEQHYRDAITLPLYPAMTDAQQATVIDALRGLLDSRGVRGRR